MSQGLKGLKDGAEATVRDIRRRTHKQYAAKEKIRIVVAGLRGKDSIAELCRREGIAESLYYSWSKEFLEAGKKRLAGDTARQASSGEVKDLRREMRDLGGACRTDAGEPAAEKKFNRGCASRARRPRPVARSVAHSRSCWALPSMPDWWREMCCASSGADTARRIARPKRS